MNPIESEHIFTENLYQIKGKVLVVLPTSWNSQSTENINLLSRILGSVKLSIDAVQIIASAEISLEELKLYNPTAILLFGVNFTPAIKPFGSENFEGVTVIASEPLNQLDELKKKSLWGVLKQAFRL